MKMFVVLGLVCLAALSVNAQETYTIFDAEEKLVGGGDCGECLERMEKGLEQLSWALNILPQLSYSVDFCKVVALRGLGNFKSTVACSTNKELNLFDYNITMNFAKPTAEFRCNFPESPAAAADLVNKAYIPKGQCGANKDIGDKLVRVNVTCSEGEGKDETFKPVELTADLTGMSMNIIVRVDSKQKSMYPLSVSVTTQEANPTTMKDNPSLQKAYECLFNDANRKALFHIVFINALTLFFTCIGDTHGYLTIFIDFILSLWIDNAHRIH